MAFIIISIVLLGYFLIATEKLTNINKAAVAIFIGTVGWVLYICYGSDFVLKEHRVEYFNFLQGATSSSVAVKQFIAQNIFSRDSAEQRLLRFYASLDADTQQQTHALDNGCHNVHHFSQS